MKWHCKVAFWKTVSGGYDIGHWHVKVYKKVSVSHCQTEKGRETCVQVEDKTKDQVGNMKHFLRCLMSIMLCLITPFK